MNGNQRCVDKDVAEKGAYQFWPTRRTWPKKEGLAQRCPRNTQDSGETPSQAHDKFCGHSKPGLLVPCALYVWSRERHTSTEESLYEATDSGSVDVEGKIEKRNGVVRPRVPNTSVTVWTRRPTSSTRRTTWW